MEQTEMNRASVDSAEAAAGIGLPRFAYREIRTEPELLEVLRLRYRVYRACRLHGFCPPNSEGIDVNCWDATARHFGLYRETASGRTLIGCFRVVDESVTAHDLTEYVAASSAIAATAFRSPPAYPLPMFSYSPECEAIEDDYRQWTRSGEHVVEVGRLCLLPEFRRLDLARLIAETTLGHGFFGSYNVDRAVFTVDLHHARFYERYGFAEITGYTWVHSEAAGVAMMATAADVPSRVVPRLTDLAQRFKQQGFTALPVRESADTEVQDGTRCARVA